MAYHIKTPGKLEVGDVYWKGDNTWTNIFDERKIYSTKSSADAVKATTVTVNGVTYQPKWFTNSVVVSE